jgi:GntR family transcriptional regulator
MNQRRRSLSFQQIADDLAARIDSGEYPPGAKLPSYSNLADLYTVSVATAQRAILILRTRGLVEGEPGRGVFVRDG